MSILQICEWLEGTPVGVLARESLWGFQILVAIHILGITISVGLLVWFDLRLLGLSMRAAPVAKVYRQLMPWAFVGFAVMVMSGGALLSGFATRAYGNQFFWIKVAALLLAGVNAVAYHRGVERRIAQWNEDARLPLPARAAGLISIVLWAVVILSGRMMAYTMY